MLQNYRLANALRTADPNHSCGSEVKANTMNQPFKKVLSIIAISNCRFLSEFLVRVSLGQMCCYLQNKNLHSMISPTLKDMYSLENKNHFVNFVGAAFVMATHVEGSFSSTSLSGDMKIVFYCKYSLEMKRRCNE